MSKSSTVKSRLPKPTSDKRKHSSFLHSTFVILCLTLVAVSVLAVLEFWLWAKVPVALAGAWQEGGSAAIFKFSRSGTMQVRLNDGRQTASRVIVEGRTMFTTMLSTGSLREETHKFTI